MLRGPTKVEYIFLEYRQDPLPPVNPSKDTLGAINTHFWDWIWWVATKEAAGRPREPMSRIGYLGALRRSLLDDQGGSRPDGWLPGRGYASRVSGGVSFNSGHPFGCSRSWEA